MVSTMKRWQMEMLGREHLELTTVPIPNPKDGEVLVKVAAVALNRRDLLVMQDGRGLPLTFPFTPASDAAGTVVEIGAGVSSFSPGDRVISTFTPEWSDGKRPGSARTPPYRTLGGFFPGVLAEYMCMPESWFVTAPSTLTLEEACTLPCSGLTAWFALMERGALRLGDTVLVEGTGGVACFGIQIAKAHGAEVIVSCSESKFAQARSLGGDHVLDRRRQDWVDEILRLTAENGADHILEIAGGAHLAKAVAASAIGGTIYQIGALEGLELSTPAMPLMLKDVTVHGIATGHKCALERLIKDIDGLTWKPVIDTIYSFDNAQEAFSRLEEGPLGKVVISVSD